MEIEKQKYKKEQIEEERKKKSLYINKTQLNENIINNFYQFYQRKVRRFDFISFLICGIILIVVAITYLMKGSEYFIGIIWNIIINTILISVGILFWVVAFRNQKYNKQEMIKIFDEDISNIINEYYFNDDTIIITNKFGETERVYEYFEAIYEDKDNYYIFVNQKNSYIMRKDSFMKGKEKEFNKFIKLKMGKNYKKRYREKNKK